MSHQRVRSLRYLREGDPGKLTPRESQLVQIVNRTQFESAFQVLKHQYDVILLEDYVGSGIAWSMATGWDEGLMVDMRTLT